MTDPVPASRRTLLAFLASLVPASLAPRPARADPLVPLRWKRRPLVVLAPAPDDPRLLRQRALVEAEAAAFAERDQVLVEVAGEAARIDGAEADGGAALRARFGVASEGFAVILVGKDGGEKARWSAPVSPGDVFARIDAMPMRRREMRDGRS